MLVAVAQYLCQFPVASTRSIVDCVGLLLQHLFYKRGYIEIICSLQLCLLMGHLLFQERKWQKQYWAFPSRMLPNMLSLTFPECSLSYHSQLRHAICIRPSLSLCRVNHKSASITPISADHLYPSTVLLSHQEEEHVSKQEAIRLCLDCIYEQWTQALAASTACKIINVSASSCVLTPGVTSPGLFDITPSCVAVMMCTLAWSINFLARKSVRFAFVVVLPRNALTFLILVASSTLYPFTGALQVPLYPFTTFYFYFYYTSKESYACYYLFSL